MIDNLMQRSEELRAAVSLAMTLTSPELIEEEMHKRDAFKDDCQAASNLLADQIDVLRAQKRALELAKDFQTTDIKRLKAAYWEQVNQRKQQRA